MNFNSDWLRWIRAWLCLILTIRDRIANHRAWYAHWNKWETLFFRHYNIYFQVHERLKIHLLICFSRAHDDRSRNKRGWSERWFRARSTDSDLIWFALFSVKRKKWKKGSKNTRSMQWYQSENMKERTNSSSFFFVFERKQTCDDKLTIKFFVNNSC